MKKTGVRQNQQQQENWDWNRTLSSKKMIIAEKKFYYRIQSFFITILKFCEQLNMLKQ